jgi:hypothetical protein
MADTQTAKTFLDYNGLSTLWSIISNKFATKAEAVKTIEVAAGTNDTVEKKLVYTTVSGEANFTTIPAATETSSGLLTADQFKTLSELNTNIEGFAPFANLQLEGKDLTLVNRLANIKLEYEGSKAAGGNAYISLVDANATGEDRAISKIDVTELVKTGLLADADVVVNPEGESNGTYLKLVFNTATDASSSDTNTVYINVTDLVEIYSAGEGISITETGSDIDDTARTGVISIEAAKSDKLGGVKLGYTVAADGNRKSYAVKLNDSNQAFVEVPWETVTVAHADSANQSEYISTTVTSSSNNSTTEPATAYIVEAKPTVKATNAFALAESSVQEVAGQTDYVNVSQASLGDASGKKYTVSLDSKVIDSLTLADKSVQTISVNTDTLSILEDGVETKGQHAYTIDLSTATKTSLGKADSAVQSINMMGTELTEASKDYTAAQAKKAMSLGSASEVNTADFVPLIALTDNDYKSNVILPDGSAELRYTVPTTKAVNEYVTNVAETTIKTTEGLISKAIENLDFEISVGETDNANTATTGEKAQMTISQITIVDGSLESVVPYALKIKDITDFRAMTVAEITAICI